MDRSRHHAGMNADAFRFRIPLTPFASWINREQAQVIDSFREENRVLFEYLQGKPRRMTTPMYGSELDTCSTEPAMLEWVVVERVLDYSHSTTLCAAEWTPAPHDPAETRYGRA